MILSINDPIKIRLTDAGEEYLATHHQMIFRGQGKGQFIPVDSDGLMKTTLYQMMYLFRDYNHLSSIPLYEDIIVLDQSVIVNNELDNHFVYSFTTNTPIGFKLTEHGAEWIRGHSRIDVNAGDRIEMNVNKLISDFHNYVRHTSRPVVNEEVYIDNNLLSTTPKIQKQRRI